MTFLLDVNVVIALLDPAHISHDAAHRWFADEGQRIWATCPIVENGVVRVVGNARYPNTPGSPALVMPLLSGLCALPGHVFWPDTLSLSETARIDAGQLLTSAQITDSYLLALAVEHGGRLATLDRRLSTKAVHGGKAGLKVIAP